MKKLLQVFILASFFLSHVDASDFRDVKVVSLKKDVQKKILVKYGSVEKIFKFRWTLYKNGGLVVLRSYDKIVAQNILYKRYKNQSFRLNLRPRGIDLGNVPYLFVKFKEFNYETREAKFELFLSDSKMQISLKDL